MKEDAVIRSMAGLLVLTLMLGNTASIGAADYTGGPPDAGWELVFEDQFDGTEADLDARWEFQNGPSGHILSSRWRENARLEDGLLKMIARKEQRAGQAR